MRLGYENITKMAEGYQGWVQAQGTLVQEQTEPTRLAAGDYFPACNLMLMKGGADRRYLNLNSDENRFSLGEIPTDYLFVEIYNERCLGCIAEINNYKTLYREFMTDSQLQQKIKLIGIGAGSSQDHVDSFRREHRIPFPLFADANWELFQCLGSPTLPTSYLIKRASAMRHKIVFVQSDHIEDIEDMKKRILRHTGRPH